MRYVPADKQNFSQSRAFAVSLVSHGNLLADPGTDFREVQQCPVFPPPGMPVRENLIAVQHRVGISVEQLDTVFCVQPSNDEFGMTDAGQANCVGKGLAHAVWLNKNHDSSMVADLPIRLGFDLLAGHSIAHIAHVQVPLFPPLFLKQCGADPGELAVAGLR